MRALRLLTALLAAASARRSDADADASDACWGSAEDWDTTSPAFLELKPDDNHWTQVSNTFGSGVEWLFRLMPGMRGKLYGRSLTLPCRCEACAYTLDTLIMYLDEDTMGWYTPDDIQHIMMDRFCYGIKWLYRSACHHILTAYFDDIAAMAMGHMTGLDICRVLRFCPYYYRRAPAIPLPSHRLPPLDRRAHRSPRPLPPPRRSGGNLWWSAWNGFPFGGAGAGAASKSAQLLGAPPGGAQQLPPPQQLPPTQQSGEQVLWQQTPPLAQAAAGTPPLGQPPQGQPLPPVQGQPLPPLQLPGQPQPQPQLLSQQPPQQPLPHQGAQELAALSLPPDVAAQRAAQPGAEPPRGLQPVGFRSNPAAQAAAANPLATMGMMGSV